MVTKSGRPLNIAIDCGDAGVADGWGADAAAGPAVLFAIELPSGAALVSACLADEFVVGFDALLARRLLFLKKYTKAYDFHNRVIARPVKTNATAIRAPLFVPLETLLIGETAVSLTTSVLLV